MSTDNQEPTRTWTAIYPDGTSPGPVSTESVPGEITLAEQGSFAFKRDTIRKSIWMTDDALDLRAWLALVPTVHGTFALSGAQKTVALLQGTNIEPGDELLDAFASEMAVWARTNDPALELSVTALP